MKEIKLTRGLVTLVDDGDFDELNDRGWYAIWSGRNFYAGRNTSDANGKRGIVLMHRVILNAQSGQYVDHINGDTLNNQGNNIRIATPSENQMNRGKPKSNTSGFKGVHWYKRCKKWGAQIDFGNKRKHLGYYSTPEQAGLAYRLAAQEYHGEFARKE